MNPVAKYLTVTALILAVLLGSAYFGWVVRGLVCKDEMATYKEAQASKAEQQRDASQQVEVKQDAATAQSGQRIDHQQTTQQKDTVYVEKQVIQYRDRWRDRDCKLSDDWLQLYNASLFGAGPAVPEAGQAGSASASASMLLPAGRN